MKAYIYSLLLVLLLVPCSVYAVYDPDFQNQGSLTADFKINYVSLREYRQGEMTQLFTPTYIEVPVSYRLAETLGGVDDIEEFRHDINTYRTYLQIWRGEPYENPERIYEADISATIAGIHLFTSPASGEDYFITISISDELIEGGCDGTACSVLSIREFFAQPKDSGQPSPRAYDGFAFHIIHQDLYSNVLFVPGIKGSRLYVGEADCDDECAEKVWEPSSNNDVHKLFLNQDGSSIRDDVFTKPSDVIDRVLLTGIYGSFIQILNDLGGDGETPLEYEAFAYDWRLSLPDLISKGVQTENRIYFASTTEPSVLLSAVNRLQEISKTKKVSLIAHSNGGLLVKALINFLGEERAKEIIDSIIFIGVPQTGAPQAIGSLLYGYREGIPWKLPFIVSTEVARTFAENSPMGYHLLPSDTYIQNSDDPVITGDASINSFYDLSTFLTTPDTTRSNILNADLLKYADGIHTELDSWTPPAGIELYQIAGFGVQTISGIEYYDDCVLILCKTKYRPTFTERGDGVVPVESAVLIPESEHVHNFWIDLREHKTMLTQKDHGSLLDIPEVQEFVQNIISSTTDSVPATISSTEPVASDRKWFHIFLHSPLALSATDSSGNYSGPGSDGEWISDIPDSKYGVFGETQFLLVPADESYDVSLDAYDAGEFTLEVQVTEDGTVIEEQSFQQVPNTNLTEATLHLEPFSADAELTIDINGDGTVDSVLEPGMQQQTRPTKNISSRPHVPELPTISLTSEYTSSTEAFEVTAIAPAVELQETKTIPDSAVAGPSTTEVKSIPHQSTFVERLLSVLQHVMSWLLHLFTF
ncbi:hypothetical protein KKH15_03015 [Patescibacteria group bacterium]|nr:hypothetical protein [Patescibacteria group bacterium]MBU1755306.1 hypothetical protein [Patescibacteria group bacterium]